MRKYGILFIFVALAIIIATVAGGATGSPAESTISGVTVQMDVETEQEYKEIGEEFADALPGVEPKSHVAILFSDGDRWVVFADEEIPVGHTVASGTVIDNTDDPDTDVSLIFADDVETDTRGEPAELTDVLDNPEQYDQEIVRITTDYQQLAYNLEVGDGSLVRKSTLAQFEGFPLEMLPPGQSGRWTASFGDPDQSPESIAQERLGFGKASLMDFQSTRYWVNAESQVDVVVLHEDGESPMFLIADVSPVGTEATIDEVQRGDHDGDVVTIESDVAEARISTKETLIKMAPCGTDAVTTPKGCVPAVADATVHAGVLYNGIPDDREEMLVYTAISNKVQTQPVEAADRRVRVTGEVVDAAELYPNADGERALIVYDIEYINHNSGTPDAARQYRVEFTDEVQKQMATSEDEYQAEHHTGEAHIEAIDYTDPHEGEVTIEILVRNDDDDSAERTVTARLGGGDPEETTVVLESGDETVISFEFATGNEGRIAVYVDGEHRGTTEHVSFGSEGDATGTPVTEKSTTQNDETDGESSAGTDDARLFPLISPLVLFAGGLLGIAGFLTGVVLLAIEGIQARRGRNISYSTSSARKFLVGSVGLILGTSMFSGDIAVMVAAIIPTGIVAMLEVINSVLK